MWEPYSPRTRIKLCWFEYLEAAYEASFIGADALGFHCLAGIGVNWRAKAEALASIVPVLPSTIEKVLLSDLPYEIIDTILRMAHFDSIQLYPDWHPSDIERLKAAHDGQLRVLKVMSAQEHENVPSEPLAFLDRYSSTADAILLDSYRVGGTGKLADADYCADIVRLSPLPVIVAGGLTPTNVGERIRRIRPFGVDVETGVSVTTREGHVLKDLGKCRAFVEAVVQADRAMGTRHE